ncbi:hypothetical protein [Cohnella fermenti]|uniref:Uncharacterized protein n=1 Tax=Cohnella fermenti TaxID=2565925 RepID=A0A4S4BYL3_9BACL|nr:hypothetical protein [Cohnella fermenti]THF80355.1 hypothetical protein E6C55_10755 [Cohnella fermenti]
MKTVERAPLKPDGFARQAEELLREPDADKCRRFAELLLDFSDPGLPVGQAVSLFIDNNEWNWLNHAPPLSDR